MPVVLRVLPISNDDTSLHTFMSLAFEKARNNAHNDVFILALEVVLNFESGQWPRNLAVAANDEPNVEFKSRQSKNCHSQNWDVIPREVKTNMKYPIENMSQTMIQETLDEYILGKCSKRSWPVDYNVSEHIMLDLLPRT